MAEVAHRNWVLVMLFNSDTLSPNKMMLENNYLIDPKIQHKSTIVWENSVMRRPNLIWLVKIVIRWINLSMGK
jgi:hypothetical protein